MGNVPNLGMARNTPSPFPNLAAGLVNTNPSYGVTAAGQTAPIVQGAPLLPWTPYQLPNLTAADSDYFVASFASGTGVTTKSNVLGTLLNAGKMPQLTDSSGFKFTPARNLVITSSGSKTCVFTIQYVDENNYVRSKVLTISLTTAGYATNFTAKQILSISLAASASDVDITYGYGNRIGLPHPLYSLIGNVALYNAAGTLFPNTPLSTGGSTAGTATRINPLPLNQWTNSNGITPVGSASATELGLVTGAAGTATPSLQTTNLNDDTGTPKARWIQFILPSDYISGSTITITANAGMLDTGAVASSAATIDFAVYKNGAGSDLSTTTAATTINSLTAANKSFVITPTGLVAGDWLDILMTVAITDVGTVAAVTGKVNSVYVATGVAASAVASNADWLVGNPSAASTVDASINGSVRLGSTDLSTGTNAPDGTADYLLMWAVSDPVGVLDDNAASVYRFE